MTRAAGILRSLSPALLLAAAPMPLAAQMLPMPSAENPRIQTVQWRPNQEVILTTLPKTGLTVMLEPGEQVTRVSVEEKDWLDVRVSPELDSFQILPQTEDLTSAMLVQTDRRDYRFSVRPGTGLAAAYLVRFEFDAMPAGTEPETLADTGEEWRYRVKGDRSVRPQSIRDDGVRTRITFGAAQALPAVFAIGPTGKEEVVNGHMRNDVFVIDRVHGELVFRIDKYKANARRNAQPENSDG